ncbi:MAG: tetratricopeptide repeat protein [Candidatus Delongbacteria bacterium]|nr:tetratricopeptide repeat protein [Candidatus Delongbacteria bacterium]
MKRFFNIAYIFLALLIPILVLNASPHTDFHEANSFYEKGEFEKAADLYRKIIDGGYESGEIYYNLGNTHYKLGNIAETIVFYERALKLAPDDRDVTENLKIAKFSLIDKTEEETIAPFFTLYNNVRDLFNIHSVKTAFYSMLFIFAVLISTYILLRNTILQKTLFYICLISLAGLFLTSYLYYDIHRIYFSRSGVISEFKVSVLSSPDDNISSELFFLHQGTKADIIRSNENWYEIELDSEKRGWIRKDQMIEI